MSDLERRVRCRRRRWSPIPAARATVPWTSRPRRGQLRRCRGRRWSPSPAVRGCDAMSELERRVAYQTNWAAPTRYSAAMSRGNRTRRGRWYPARPCRGRPEVGSDRTESAGTWSPYSRHLMCGYMAQPPSASAGMTARKTVIDQRDKTAENINLVVLYKP